MLYLEMKSSHSQRFMPKIFVYVFFWVFMLSDCGHSRPQTKSTNNEVPVKQLNSSVLNRTLSFLPSLSSSSSRLSPMSSFKESNLTTAGSASRMSHGNRKRRSPLLENGSAAGQSPGSLTEVDSEREIQESKRHHVLSIRSKNKVHWSDSDSVGGGFDENALPRSASEMYREPEDEDLANYIYYVINDFIDEKEESESIRSGAEALNDQRRKDFQSESSSSTMNAHVNLVRKRRQKSSPGHHRRDKGDDAHRRRQRRRNRRHRHTTTDNSFEEGETRTSAERFAPPKHQDGFFLKSDSPSYIITSASELKKDWCRTIPLRQKVTERNCKTKIIMNNFCYGQCNSFFIPHPGRRGSQAFQSCAFCKPHRLKYTNITLHCPGQNPPKKEKRIMMVESCRCITQVLQ